MSWVTLMGVLTVVLGIYDLRTYIQRRRWPLVPGSLDSVDMKIEGTGNPEGVGFFIHPKFIQKYKYFYHGTPYSIEIQVSEIKKEAPQLRVNPENPSEAYEDNKTILRPILGIVVGIVLILGSMKFKETE